MSWLQQQEKSSSDVFFFFYPPADNRALIVTGNAIWVVVTFLQNLNSEHSRNASYFTYLDIDTYTCYYYSSLLFKQSWISTVCPQHIHVFPVVLSKFYLNAWIYGFMCLLSIRMHVCVCVCMCVCTQQQWRMKCDGSIHRSLNANSICLCGLCAPALLSPAPL